MKILEKQFKGKGSQSLYQFKQVARNGNIAMYAKTWVEEFQTYYEVIIVRQQEERKSTIGGELVKFEAKEIYPTDNDFGTYGWTTKDFSRAIEIYNNLIENETNKGTSNATIQDQPTNNAPC